MTLPRLAPAIVAGAMLSFTFSFDDVVISNFTAGAGNDTWPLRILSGLRFGLNPDLNAAATMMLGVTLLGLGGAALILRRTSRMQGQSVGLGRGRGSAWLSARRSSTTSAASLHVPPPGAPGIRAPPWSTVETFERPERLIRSRRVLEGSGVLAHVDELAGALRHGGRAAARAHAGHVARVLEAARSETASSSGTRRGPAPGTHDADAARRRRAARGHRGRARRPQPQRVRAPAPAGHHAERDERRWASACSTTRRSRRAGRSGSAALARVAIVDWDVHHGNGTEEIFLDDPTVLTISLHQDGLYPADTGRLGVRGAEGANVNVPLPACAGDDGYVHAFDEVVAPRSAAFAPDLLIVGAGPGRLGHGPARPHVDQHAGLPRAHRSRRRARRRGVRRRAWS